MRWEHLALIILWLLVFIRLAHAEGAVNGGNVQGSVTTEVQTYAWLSLNTQTQAYELLTSELNTYYYLDAEGTYNF